MNATEVETLAKALRAMVEAHGSECGIGHVPTGWDDEHVGSCDECRAYLLATDALGKVQAA